MSGLWGKSGVSNHESLITAPERKTRPDVTIHQALFSLLKRIIHFLKSIDNFLKSRYADSKG